MTKKDYEAIAEVLHDTKQTIQLEASAEDMQQGIYQTRIKLLERVAVGLCRILKQDNPRFNGVKFMQASGL